MELQWPLILFTTFIAWSAGLFGAQGIYLLRGKGSKVHMQALLLSFVLMLVGGIAVFFHLQHWERIFNGFGHITSGITQELIAIVLMFVVMVIVFVYLRRSGEKAEVPSWAGVLALVTAVLLVVVMGHSYMMASLPAWNTVLQVASLLGGACALGPATMAFLCALNEEEKSYHGKIMIIGQGINVVCVVAYLIAMNFASAAFTSVAYWFDPVQPTQTIVDTTALSPFAGSSGVMSFLAILFAFFGCLAAFIGKKQEEAWKMWAAVAVVGAFLSALLLRVVFYQMGVSVYPFF